MVITSKQTTTVTTYMAQFEHLMNEVKGKTEESLLSFFIAGLKTDIEENMLVR